MNFFEKSITASTLRGPQGNRILSDIKENSAVRIIHQGHGMKVIVTEERYLELVSLWHIYEESKPQSLRPLAELSRAADLEAGEVESLNVEVPAGEKRVAAK